MTNISSNKAEVKSINLLKTCLLGFVTATGLGLIVLPAHADQVSGSKPNNIINQTTQQQSNQQSDGTVGDQISIKNANSNATVSGENNHVEQEIQQLSDQQQIGGDDEVAEDSISIQYAENNAATRGNYNRTQQRINQSTLHQRDFRN